MYVARPSRAPGITSGLPPGNAPLSCHFPVFSHLARAFGPEGYGFAEFSLAVMVFFYRQPTTGAYGKARNSLQSAASVAPAA
jgi:hypothetical protein